MCVTPKYVIVTKRDYCPERIEVPCRKCWACRINRQNDLIGRGMADRAWVDGGVFLTLTYDDKKLTDPTQTTLIHKEDFQNFMKRVRYHVGETRYIAAGEYGSKKGRVHFHAILLTKGHCPVYPHEQRFWDDELWPWGHMWAEPCTMRSMRYVAKYLQKQREENSQEWVTYSRFPILGFDFCLETAWRAVEQKVFPRDFNYFPPGYTGHPKLKFSFYGKAQEIILDTIFDLWPEAWELKKTPWMQNAVDRYVKLKQRHTWDHLPTEQKLIYLDEDIVSALHHTNQQEHLKHDFEAEQALIQWQDQKAAETRSQHRWLQ